MTSTAAGARFDVAAFIDERPIGWREITTLIVVSIVLHWVGPRRWGSIHSPFAA